MATEPASFQMTAEVVEPRWVAERHAHVSPQMFDLSRSCPSLVERTGRTRPHPDTCGRGRRATVRLDGRSALRGGRNRRPPQSLVRPPLREIPASHWHKHHRRSRNACERRRDFAPVSRPTRSASVGPRRSAKPPCTRGKQKRRRPVAERPSPHRTGTRLVRPCRTSLAHQPTELRPFSGTYACRAKTAMGRTAYAGGPT
jgi:hypothetical protein